MNFKKCIGLCLALLLLVSNIGLAFNVNYCGGKIATVSVRIQDNSVGSEKSCCTKKVITKDSCCKNKTVHFQKKSDHATLKVFSFEPYVAWIIPKNKITIVALPTTFFTKSIISYFCDAHPPPLFKLYHQFIFYA